MTDATPAATASPLLRPQLLVASILAIVAVQLLALHLMGHPWICACGDVRLWYGNPSGAETSQHLSDWYTFSHVLHGFLFYGLLRLIAPRTPVLLRLTLAVGLEAAWEIAENTPMIIDRYRQQALAQGYFGDSLINSLSDTLAMVSGFIAARFLPVRASVAIVVAVELFLLVMIRDNLTLNILQLIAPNEDISRWQSGGGVKP